MLSNNQKPRVSYSLNRDSFDTSYKSEFAIATGTFEGNDTDNQNYFKK
jgi:hypothetical protein